MKYTITLLLLAAGFTVLAQEKETAAYHYKAEGNDYYQVYHAIPNSAVAYYTTHGGGKRICTVQVDATGSSLYTGNRKRNIGPALVINTVSPATNVKGNNHVMQFYGVPEFTINAIQVKEGMLTWNAAVINTETYVFEIWASDNGKEYQKAATVIPVSEGLNCYTFPIAEESKQPYYQIKVTGVKNELTWASRIMDMTSTENVNVYPSLFTKEIHIDLPEADENNSYTLTNITGQVIKTGKLSGTENIILLNDSISSGMYILKTNVNNQVSITKLLKK